MKEKLAAVWNLNGPVSAGPQFLRRGNKNTPFVGVHPDGTWVAVSDSSGDGSVSLWPLRRSYPSTLLQQEFMYSGLAVDPNGRFVVTCTGITGDGNVYLVSLETQGDARPRMLIESDQERGFSFVNIAVSPDGERVGVGTWGGSILLVSLSDGTTERLSGFSSRLHQILFDSSGTRLAAASGLSRAEDAVIRVWDLETGGVKVLDDGHVPVWIGFGPDGRLYSSGKGGFKFWDLGTGDSELVIPDVAGKLSPDGRYFLGGELAQKDVASGSPARVAREVTEASVYDLETGEVRSLASHGKILRMDWHPSGEAVVTTTKDGLVQVGPVTGEPPHRLPGHYGNNTMALFHPNGKWILTIGEEGTLRLWPVPDLSKPAFRTLPYDELMARLRSLTNYRVVKDESDPTGYRIEYGPLPDWQQGVPEW
jgi:WD40 repeat protein